jgi:ATP adenylyltransferase
MMDRIYAPWRSKYFTMKRNGGCLFCEIRSESGEGESLILKRGRHWFVILNLFPYTNGHIMIVANRHIERLSEISAEEGEELIELLSLSEGAIRKAYNPEGMNVGVNLGASAGAGIVGHLLFPLCPRWTGDTNFMTSLAETRVVSESLEESRKKLAPYFEG